MVDSISRSHSKELAQLQRRFGTQFILPAFLLLIAAYLVFVFIIAILPFYPESSTFADTERSAIRRGSPELKSLIATQQEYRSWLEFRGTSGEVRVFNEVSEALYLASQDKITFSWLLDSFNFTILRVSFLLFASGRIWLFFIMLAVVFARKRYQPFTDEHDILGKTGNGRIYYTGIRAGLTNVNSAGAPDFQVTGLACPPLATLEEVSKSKLGAFLKKMSLDNQTNNTLAAILVAADGVVPPYAAQPHKPSIAPAGEEHISEVAYLTLVKVFELYQSYKTGSNNLPSNIGPSEKLSEPFTVKNYIDLLSRALHQSLPASFQNVISTLSPEIIATTVLSVHAGKTLSYADEGGRWIQKSNYPQLSARAALHSIPNFADEYNFEERKTIRRALIYSSRSSAFGAVRIARDLDLSCRALRQWVEVLMEPPVKIISTAFSTELYALIYEVHELWKQAFSVSIHEMDEKYPNEIHATLTNIMFMPVNIIMEIARKVVPE